MSPPEARLETQKRRHRGPLIGMAVAVLVAVLLIAYWVLGDAGTTDAPSSTGAPIQSEGAPGQTPGTVAPRAPDATVVPDAAPGTPPAPGGQTTP